MLGEPTTCWEGRGRGDPSSGNDGRCPRAGASVSSSLRRETKNVGEVSGQQTHDGLGTRDPSGRLSGRRPGLGSGAPVPVKGFRHPGIGSGEPLSILS